MQRRAFTLIELLVVVTIITLLIAMLLPSLNQARELGRRVVCASQLHQWSLATVNYASDNYGEFAPGPAALKRRWGHDVVRTRPTIPGWADQYFAAGRLIDQGYAKSPQMLYCPSWRHPVIQYDTVQTDPWGAGQWGGWPAAPNPGPTAWWGGSYAPRSTIRSAGRISPVRSPNLRDPASMAWMADFFMDSNHMVNVGAATTGSGEMGHVVGYNSSYVGGSVSWINDPEMRIIAEDIPHDGGYLPKGLITEAAWVRYFDGGGS